MIKILLGGSPCTFWSIAQKNNRETEAEGLGWELFKNYLIAKEKFKPDFFLYENNKSAAQAIKDQISKELGVDLMYINSALVSAQNRQRFYVFNWEVEQPKDRGILLKDILETSAALPGNPNKQARDDVAERIENVGECETVQKAIPKLVDKFGYVPEQFNAYNVSEITEKSPTLSTGSMVTSSCATTRFEKVDCPTMRVPESTKQGYVDIKQGDCVDLTFPNSKTRRGRSMKEKSNCLTAASSEFYQYLGTVDSNIGECAMFAHPHGWNEGLITYDKSQTITTGSSTRQQNVLVQDAKSGWGIIRNEKPRAFINKVYKVTDGLITIKDKQYPVKLKDGYYIIRKLTPIECERLQTLPDNYTAAVSNSQRYKGLGNGWTAEVIIHILNGALKDVTRDEEIIVLSMYDGIGTGRYCLDKMGFTNVKYFAYEIDKYAKQIAMSNYPDIIQMGDAFDLRHPDWTIGY